MEFLEEMMIAPEKEEAEHPLENRGRPPELKSYIMESNDGLPKTDQVSPLKVAVSPTNLKEVSILRLFQEGNHSVFYMDATDPRFLILYTNDLADKTDKLFDRLVLSAANRLDKIYVPTETLGRISDSHGNVFEGFGLRFSDSFALEELEKPIQQLRMSVTGSNSREALEALHSRKKLARALAYSRTLVRRGTRQSFVADDIRYTGRIITRSGNSIDDHVSLLEIIRKNYRNLVEEVERNRIGTRTIENRTLLEGQAFDLNLERQIENLDGFVDSLLNSTGKFRLWGLKSEASRDVRRVVAVDLHTGDPIDLEIASSLVRIYLPKEACGNTVLRLYVNLQHTFDSEIRLNDEKLATVG